MHEHQPLAFPLYAEAITASPFHARLVAPIQLEDTSSTSIMKIYLNCRGITEPRCSLSHVVQDMTVRPQTQTSPRTSSNQHQECVLCILSRPSPHVC